MKIRVISLLLAIVLTLLLIPVTANNASAAATTSDEIVEQIRQVYRKARRKFGGSFNGFCGSLVSYQTYLMGIDESCHPRDGNRQYDQYCDVGITCGGYRVDAYSAKQYTMKEAFDAITHNGTVDAYNLLVGFHWTHTAAGSKYGHALLIHAVIDGMVYFVECYNASIGGKHYSEGTPIVCSVDTFCDYYASWTRFEGIIEFGLKNYADKCTYYPMTFDAMVMEETEVLFEPVDAMGGERDVEHTLLPGDKLQVNGLYETPAGDLWYKVDTDAATGYVPAAALAPLTGQQGGLTVTGLKVPSSLYKGKSFSLDGTICGMMMESVQVRVYNTADETTPVLQSVIAVNGSSFRLNNATLDKAMTFRKLPVGTYRIEITADASYYTVSDGQVQEQVDNYVVWNSLFEIVSNKKTHYTVTFCVEGGEASFDRKTVCTGTAVGTLPTAWREGSIFAGWSLDAEGNEPVTEETVITGNVTLYAQWLKNLSSFTGWKQEDGRWHYYQAGNPVNGAFTFAGLTLYQNHEGNPLGGWILVDDALRFYNKNGVQMSGWQQSGENTIYVREDGTRAVGWVEVEGQKFLFDKNGKMQTGWATYENETYYFRKDGTFVTGWQMIDGDKYLFSDTGVLQLMQGGNTNKDVYVVFDRNVQQEFAQTQNHFIMG